jgi:hypothetical protein
VSYVSADGASMVKSAQDAKIRSLRHCPSDPPIPPPGPGRRRTAYRRGHALGRTKKRWISDVASTRAERCMHRSGRAMLHGSQHSATRLSNAPRGACCLGGLARSMARFAE